MNGSSETDRGVATLALTLHAVYRGAHAYLHRYVRRMRAAAPASEEEFHDELEYLEAMLLPDPGAPDSWFAELFLAAATELQAERLLAAEEDAATLSRDDFVLILGRAWATGIKIPRLRGYLDLREEQSGLVDLPRIFPGMTEGRNDVLWRWVGAARRTYDRRDLSDGNSMTFLCAEAAFDDAIRAALTPAEHRRSLSDRRLHALPPPVEPLHARLVREEISRVWGIGSVI
jgi:hypothetical protein